MANQTIFKRYEMKYMLTRNQFQLLRKLMEQYMIPDEYGQSTNCSLYYDTPKYLLIRRSMDKPVYKEKLRVRSYGVSKPDSTVFIELKKKYEGVTYKRRVAMTEAEASRYLLYGERKKDSQIIKEIDYCFTQYKDLAPAIFLSYDRQAFYGKEDKDFRMTFDENILWRDYDLELTKGIYGESILDPDQVLLEIKVAAAIPKWLVNFLTENKINKVSFSKYGTAYRLLYERSKDLLNLYSEGSGYIKVDNEAEITNGGLFNYA